MQTEHLWPKCVLCLSRQMCLYLWSGCSIKMWINFHDGAAAHRCRSLQGSPAAPQNTPVAHGNVSAPLEGCCGRTCWTDRRPRVSLSCLGTSEAWRVGSQSCLSSALIWQRRTKTTCLPRALLRRGNHRRTSFCLHLWTSIRLLWAFILETLRSSSLHLYF